MIIASPISGSSPRGALVPEAFRKVELHPAVLDRA